MRLIRLSVDVAHFWLAVGIASALAAFA